MTSGKVRLIVVSLLTAIVEIAPANAQVLPHIAVGGTYTTEFLVINAGANAGTISMSFFDDAGKPMAVNFPALSANTTGLVTKSPLSPGGSIFVEASNPNGPIRSGSVIVTASAGISVAAVFRSKASDGKYYEASVGTTSGNTRFTMPFDATTFAPTGDQIYTGVAVVNTDSTNSSTIACTATDSSGAVIPNALSIPTLAPGGHWANYLFPALTGKRGTLDCSASTRVGAIGLRYLGTNAFSSLTVVESAASTVPGPGTTTVPTWLLGTWADSAGDTLTFYSDGRFESVVNLYGGLNFHGTFQVSQNAVVATYGDGDQKSYAIVQSGGVTTLVLNQYSVFRHQ
jgi:hypothetical protein